MLWMLNCDACQIDFWIGILSLISLIQKVFFYPAVKVGFNRWQNSLLAPSICPQQSSKFTCRKSALEKKQVWLMVRHCWVTTSSFGAALWPLLVIVSIFTNSFIESDGWNAGIFAQFSLYWHFTYAKCAFV